MFLTFAQRTNPRKLGLLFQECVEAEVVCSNSGPAKSGTVLQMACHCYNKSNCVAWVLHQRDEICYVLLRIMRGWEV